MEKNDTVHGIKGSKERITVLLCCNKSGTDKCKPMVIGKSLRPRCFKKIDPKSLPVDYQANKKAWMNSVLFIQWPNEEQLLEKCMNIEADLHNIVLKLKQKKKQTVIGDFFCSV